MRSARSSSTGSASSQASSGEAATQQIFVKLLSGEIITMTVPQDTTIATLYQLLALRTSATPSSIRLLYGGKHLVASKATVVTSSVSSESASASTTPSATTDIPTLASLSIPPAATLHITLPIRGGMPPKKQRCQFKDCKDAAQRIVGDCSFCDGHYCGKHRMLEEHWCTGLENCKAEGRERNKNTLEAERTMVRGV